MKNLKIALVSQKFAGSVLKCRQKSVEMIEKVAKDGAKLVILQELHEWAYFCQSERVENFALAENFNESLKFWGETAKKFGIVLVTSLFEKRAPGLFHNTAIVFENNGEIAGKYRKMHIPDDPNFYEKFYFTPGDLGFEPINTSIGRLGVLVCWDQWYPEAARLMALKGAEILIYPTAIGWFDGDDEVEKSRQLEAWVAVQRGHAVANALPVIVVNRVGFEAEMISDIIKEDNFNGEISDEILNENDEISRENLDKICKKSNDKKNASKISNGIRFWGNSFVFGAQGEQIFRANSTDEIAKVVELDMQRCENVRAWWPFLRDRRIDAYDKLTKRFID